jgi:tetratricopeptide (TPR) repeat protein
MSQGDLDVAESNIQAGFDLSRAHGTPAEAPAFVKLLGLIRTEHGDLEEALPLYREGLLIYQEMGQPFWEAVTHAHIARVLFDLGDIDGARQSAQAALDLAEGHDFTWATSRARVTLGRLAAEAGDDARALDLLWQALKEQQGTGDSTGAVNTLRYLGHFHLERGQAADAESRFLAALNAVQDTGDRLALARTLEGLAGVLASSKPVQAATLIGAAMKVLVQARARQWRREQAYIDRVCTTIRDLIGQGALQDALCQGGELSAETASDAARTWTSPPSS